jgi:hypothetical protein
MRIGLVIAAGPAATYAAVHARDLPEQGPSTLNRDIGKDGFLVRSLRPTRSTASFGSTLEITTNF